MSSMAEVLLQYDMIAHKSFRDMAATTFYVRMRVPADALVTSTHPKQLTMDNVKFGIAYSLIARNYGYSDDNGYMSFSFECASRSEALIVEMIMKNDFADLAVLGSFEYLDVRGLAERLGHEHVPGSYYNYTSIARKLFVHMVETAKLVFPNKYLGRYGIEHAHGTRGGGQITQERAIEYGFRTPTTSWTPISSETAEPRAPTCNAVCRPIKPMKTLTAVKFSDVAQLAADPEGAEKANMLQQSYSPSSLDMAALRLYYATHLWMIDPTTVDEAFYMKCAVSNETYRKAKRFISMLKDTLPEMQERLAEQLELIRSAEARGIKGLVSRVTDDHSMLVIGANFLQLCLKPEQMDRLKDLQPVTIGATTLSEAFGALKRSMTAVELSRMFCLFDLKQTCSDLIALKKIMAMAFNMRVARQSTRTDCKGFRLVDVSPREWAAIIDTYASQLFASEEVIGTK